MAKTKKIVNVLSVAALASMILSTNALAKVDSYSVKVGNDVFSYDKAQLTESFLADKAGNADGAKLYKDFATKLETAKGFYAFHDDKTNRYIDFKDVQNAFLADKEKFNLEAYVETDAAKAVADLPAVVKAVTVDKGEVKVADVATVEKKEEVKVTTISAIKLTSPVSAQAVVGTKGVITAVATDSANKPIAGAKVVFEVTTPVQSQNKLYKVAVTTDKDGVATLTNEDGKPYIRTAADTDTIVAYAEENPATRTEISKVYWGLKPILTVKADNATPLSNGVVNYTATLTNPVTGEPMANRDLRVVFAENIGKEGTHATATAAGSYGQRLFQDVYGQSSTMKIATDANGIAKFSVTASHEPVTPIVFYDNEKFYTNSLYDSSQYLASFAGNNNEKFDARELNAKADKVEFVNAVNTISVDVKEAGAYASTNYKSGKEYVVTAKDKDGKALAGRVINVAIKELQNGLDSRARIIGSISGLKASKFSNVNLGSSDYTDNRWDGSSMSMSMTQDVLQDVVRDANNSNLARKVAVRLDKNGQATFAIGSDRVNTTATPVIWIDGDTPDRYTGRTNGMLDEALDTKFEAPAATFIESRVASVDFYETTGYPVPANTAAEFEYWELNQNGDYVNSVEIGSRVTFVIANTGYGDIQLKQTEVNGILDNIVLDQLDGVSQVYLGELTGDVTIKPGQYRTISGTVSAAILLRVHSVDVTKGGASVSITASGERTDAAVRNNPGNKYLEPVTAKATFTNAANYVEVAKTANYPFVGKLRAAVKDNKINVDLPESRWFGCDLSTDMLNNTQIFGGLVTAISDKVNVNDFTQATYITDDVTADIYGKKYTSVQKLYAMLGKGAAVQVTFDASSKITQIRVLYTADMYDVKRIPATVQESDASKIQLATDAMDKFKKDSQKDLRIETNLKAAEASLKLAKVAVNQLPAGDLKTYFAADINLTETKVTDARTAFDKNAADDKLTEQVVNATLAVDKAAKTRAKADIEKANQLVNELPDGAQKTKLKAQLDDVNVAANQDSIDVEVAKASMAELNYDGVAPNLQLQTQGAHGSMITWAEKEDVAKVAEINGNVVTITASDADKVADVVTLVAIIRKGEAKTTREFKITVNAADTVVNKDVTKNVTVKPGTMPGQTIVVIEISNLAAGKTVNDYTVTVDGKVTNLLNGKFVVTLDKTLTQADAEKLVNVTLK